MKNQKYIQGFENDGTVSRGGINPDYVAELEEMLTRGEYAKHEAAIVAGLQSRQFAALKKQFDEQKAKLEAYCP